MLADITDRGDIERLVRAFYRSAFTDALIGRIFTEIAHMDLERHMPIMCDFWETVLFRAGLYRRNALQVHVVLNAQHRLTQEHFDRWLSLWSAAVDGLHSGPKAERAKVQAQRIAGSMLRRLEGRSGSEFETIGARDGAAMPELRADAP